MTLPTSRNQLVLISGINGYIAAQTAKFFLDAGYSVRGTVRSRNSAKALVHVLQSFVEAGRLEIVEVKDITVDGAFDKAVQGVNVIAHLASPVNLYNTNPEYVIGTAVQGTTSILNSALKFGSTWLKTVVYMSSMAAMFSNLKELPHTYTEKDWNDESENQVARLGPEAGGLQIYRASKTAAEKAFWAFREKHKPNFAMTAVNPVFVQGPPLAPPDDPANLNDTLKPVWAVFSSEPMPPYAMKTGTVDVRDVAEIVAIVAERSTETDGQRYLLRSAAGTPIVIADILHANLPAERNIKPGNEYAAGYVTPPSSLGFDSSKAAKLLGRDWINYEQTILDTAKVFEKYL